MKPNSLQRFTLCCDSQVKGSTYTMKICTFFVSLILTGISSSTYAGTQVPQSSARRQEFRTEIDSPGGISIESAHATWWRGRIIVGGFVEKKFGYSGGSPNSHLDVIVLNEEGRTLSTIPTNYFPRPIPANYHGRVGRATYAESLPSVPPAGSKIRVFHHQSSISECRKAHLSK